MKFFYSSGTMGFNGNGYFWHRFFKFPKLPFVTKTVTMNRRSGYPFAIIHLGRSIWNHIGLHNGGLDYWLQNFYNPDAILSLSGTDDEIQMMCDKVEGILLKGIELNFSCPNISSSNNKILPQTCHDIQIKLNYLQDPYKFDISKIKEISVNSVPMFNGGISGKMAQKYNWRFIERFCKEGLPVAGSSANSFKDLVRLKDLGCDCISLGSVLLTNPFLVNKLHDIEL